MVIKLFITEMLILQNKPGQSNPLDFNNYVANQKINLIKLNKKEK